MSEAALRQTEAAVLEANAAFYRAFSKGDIAAMSALWAEHGPVACLHPMSSVLVGRAAVLESWREILREPPPFELRCDLPVVHLLADVAVVTCYEGNGRSPAHLAATNVFVHEKGAWRMVHHQAGPLAKPLAMPADRSSIN
jgi:ketosteroid isomerase-like protein